jgi:phage/plasmid primase-like uncharacterized protein
MIDFTTSLTHPYAQRKGILFPIWVDEKSNIVCPLFAHGVFDGENSVISYQRISECGKIKKFDSGKPVTGGYWILGGAPDPYSVVLIAEGLATAAALARQTQLKTAVAYGCHNMGAVAQDIVDSWSCQPILCPDVGSQLKAKYPCLPSPCGAKNFDWCDYFQQGGDNATQNPIGERLFGFRGWQTPIIPIRTPSN